MNELALFAGAGGGILGGKLLGWRTVCAVEIDKERRQVLMQRQNDGVLDPFPIWDDVRTFDGHPWRGKVDVVSGGFPCQDISAAGKGAGIEGERSGLWREMARIISEVQPRFAFVENSPMLTLRGLDRVLADLTALGFDSEWGVVSAANAGFGHNRKRLWVIANAEGIDLEAWHSMDAGRDGSAQDTTGRLSCLSVFEMRRPEDFWNANPPVFCRSNDGIPDRVVRSSAAGDGQVPAVVELAWKILTGRLQCR